MSFDVSGEPIHTRCLAVVFSQAEGDSVEFRADILDLRKGGLMALAGRITMAGIIHKMELHGSFDARTGELERLTWDQSHVMHEPNGASRGECCRDPMDRLSALVGTRLGDGFVADLKRSFGGPLGCTHVNTLFQELSAFVARFRARREEPGSDSERHVVGERLASRSLFFDAFFSEERTETTALVVRLADLLYAPLDEQGSEVLAEHIEVRLRAEVELAGWRIRTLEARERSRRGPSCDAAAWQDRSSDLHEFADQSLGGGMAKRCLGRFGDRPTDARLLSALLGLGPGMTQVGAAVSDTLAPATSARPAGAGLPGPGPCYLLRAGGPLMASMFSAPDESTADGSD